MDLCASVHTCDCVCLRVLMQSPQRVDIAEDFAEQCRENLELSPCKEIFTDCRKWDPIYSLSPVCHVTRFLTALSLSLAHFSRWNLGHVVWSERFDCAFLFVPGRSMSTWVELRIQTIRTACTLTAFFSGRCWRGLLSFVSTPCGKQTKRLDKMN